MDRRVETHELALDIMPGEHHKNWEEAKSFLVARAIVGCARVAQSYRDFNVGCSVMSYNKAKGEYYTAHGGNYKPKPDRQNSGNKLCAERSMVRAAEANGDTEIIGLVIASNQTQPDLGLGINSDVLCPCEECRKMFAESHLIKPWTRIMLVKLIKEVAGMDMVEFYERLGRVNSSRVHELIEISKEMSCSELVQKIKQGNV